MNGRIRARSVAGYGLTLGGRLGSAAANVVSLLILVRALEPEGVGLFSLAVSTMVVVATVADAGLRTGFLRKIARSRMEPPSPGVVSDGRTGRSLAGLLAFEHLAGFTLGALLLAGRESLADLFFGGKAGIPLVALIMSGVVAHNAYHLATAPSQARLDFRAFFGYQIAWAVARLVGITLLAAAGVREPRAYLAAHIASLALTAAGVFALERETSFSTLFGAWSLGALRSCLSEVRAAHWVATGTLLLTTMSQLGVFALGHWSSLAEVGLFAAVQRFVQVFQIGVSALWTFLLPKVLAFDGPALADYVARLRRRFLQGALLVAAGSGLAGLILPLLLPQSLGDGRLVLFLLAAAAFAEAYASLLAIVFLNVDAYRYVVLTAAGKLGVGILLAALWAPMWGAPGAAAACLAAELLCLACLALGTRAILERGSAAREALAPSTASGSP